jgi:hypothetical protein
MAHFAKIENGIVTQVIVAKQDVIDSGLFGNPSSWVQTSYNTHGGIHYEPNTNPPVPSPDQSKALRANYAGIGYTYDLLNDVFYLPQPYPSWTISAPTWLWKPPIPYPNDGKEYYWDEATLSWVEIVLTNSSGTGGSTVTI